jgi:hypothetical protein
MLAPGAADRRLKWNRAEWIKMCRQLPVEAK